MILAPFVSLAAKRAIQLIFLDEYKMEWNTQPTKMNEQNKAENYLQEDTHVLRALAFCCCSAHAVPSKSAPFYDTADEYTVQYSTVLH